MITAIYLPADDEQPLRKQRIVSGDVETYRAAVEGNLQVVTLERPSASLYVNEDGKRNYQPLNQRATVLLWVHNGAFCGRDPICGDALLVGPPDQHCDDTNVPEEYVRLLFNGGRYRVEVQVHGEDAWYHNRVVFDDWFSAYVRAVDLAQWWTLVANVRVVAAP
ncbi:DUF3846 domain-containing protein [Fodinicola acaciae]|uniref:DUF3846 domain-containing protein n=1 Tax=Fodinicola acaciae TaxID=2681555 RepID=UPI0013D3DB16|nr:DUF3846 domain-containing protein [Fodinicola acaciae]